MLLSRLGLHAVKIAVLSTHAVTSADPRMGRGEGLANCGGHTGHGHDKQSQYGKELEPPMLNLESSALAAGRARLLRPLTVLLLMEESQQS